MIKNLKKYLLEIVVFLSGAVVMVYELAGSRVLGPYLGTSMFIWTSLIGIILGSLSLGYWLGGRLADRKPQHSALAWIILIAAVCIGMTTLVKGIFLGYLPRFIDGLKWQSVVASIFLFAPASIFLGMVSPYAVRLKISALQTSGATVGQLYAISTVGSIAGTFAAGFWLIPVLGTTNLLVSLAVMLALLSALLFVTARQHGQSALPFLFIASIIYFFTQSEAKADGYIDKDTQYNRIWIYDAVDDATGKPIKFMRINNESSSAMFLDSKEPVFAYARYYRLAEYFTPGFRSALILGGAAYTYPMYFLEKYPEATIDVVEIDPELTRLARDHFGLKDNPRMRIFHEDARTFINRSDYKYDVIYGDTFRSLYTLPWHLTTREAMKRYYDLLNDGGCLLVNIISSIEGNSGLFLEAELATARAVFPCVCVFAVMDPSNQKLTQSIMLAAVKSETRAGFDESDSLLNEYLTHDVTDKIGSSLPVLTDDLAPVDFYTNKGVR